MKEALAEIKESWNSHYIRKSRHHTVPGIPNQLFLLPESVGAADYKKQYDERDLQEADLTLGVTEEDHCVYQEYFAYSARFFGTEVPQNWRDALHLYERLLAAA